LERCRRWGQGPTGTKGGEDGRLRGPAGEEALYGRRQPPSVVGAPVGGAYSVWSVGGQWALQWVPVTRARLARSWRLTWLLGQARPCTKGLACRPSQKWHQKVGS